jgi:GntR family phosphonate transport system transcriptional regulator
VLAGRFGVNRHTVRRALAALAAEGLVRAAQGSGTFVEDRPLPYPIGPRTRFSEIVARGGREPGGRVVWSGTVAADAFVAGALKIGAGSPVLQLNTVHSADGAPISSATSWLPLPRFGGLDAALAEGLTLSAAFARYGAGDYRRAETRISARPAAPEEAERLELAPGRVVMIVDSVNVDREGIPVQATVATFAADRVEIVVES